MTDSEAFPKKLISKALPLNKEGERDLSQSLPIEPVVSVAWIRKWIVTAEIVTRFSVL